MNGNGSEEQVAARTVAETNRSQGHCITALLGAGTPAYGQLVMTGVCPVCACTLQLLWMGGNPTPTPTGSALRTPCRPHDWWDDLSEPQPLRSLVRTARSNPAFLASQLAAARTALGLSELTQARKLQLGVADLHRLELFPAIDTHTPISLRDDAVVALLKTVRCSPPSALVAMLNAARGASAAAAHERAVAAAQEERDEALRHLQTAEARLAAVVARAPTDD